MSAENASHIDDLRFKAETEDGVVLECEALLMFDSPFFGKSYIVYTDGGTDEDGFTNVYASSYSKDTLMVPEDSGFASIDLSPIEDDEEWNIIQEQLERYQQAAGGAEPQDGEDPIPLITELNSGGELEPSFEYRFEDGSTVTFLMELNTKSDYCQECGYDGEIQIVEDDGKLVWECPKCGNRDQEKLNVARRTCGYIGTQFWNQGRTQEIKDRVLHL